MKLRRSGCVTDSALIADICPYIGGDAFLGHVDRQVLPAADMEAAPSILWFAAIQGVQCKRDLAGLAPEGCFIPAEAIEGLGRVDKPIDARIAN
jgi:hypothetical protein